MKKCFAIFLIGLMCLLTLSLSEGYKRIPGDLRTSLAATPPEGMVLSPAGEFQIGSGDFDHERLVRPHRFSVCEGCNPLILESCKS